LSASVRNLIGVCLPVITSLDPCSQISISTGCLGTVIQAGIRIDIVSVIAGFDPDVQITIATAGSLTTVCASITVVSVAIVADLDLLRDSVTTARTLTTVGTLIVIHLIAIVAIFPKGSTTITTGRRLTAVGAMVFIHHIAIITSFVAILALEQVSSGDTIATSCLPAVVPAGIIVIAVAIVTMLACLHDHIAAARQKAGV
jgi:hypothetical protein